MDFAITCQYNELRKKQNHRKNGPDNEPVFAKIGQKYGKTPAQVILRWHTQMGFAVIPGSKNVDHIKDNLDIMDFRLTEEEMAEVAKLDRGERYYHRTDEQLKAFAAWRPAFETK